MRKIKDTAKKHGITVSLAIGLVTSSLQTYQAHEKVLQEKMMRERNEIFFSDYQDIVDCKFDSLKIKNCK